MKSKLKSLSLKRNSSNLLNISNEDKTYAFVSFENFASVEANNLVVDASPGTIFIRTPGTSFKIAPLRNYSLSYSCFSCKGSDASKILSLSNVEPNILLKPLQVHYADSILTKVESELSRKDTNFESIICGHILELFAKTFRLCNHDFTEILPDHSQNLRDLRSEIHENFSKHWKIDDMAARMNLSTSRFASLYKSQFKISPTEDLIQTRIDQAKKMLSASKVSVKKVSDACGFESVHYFHRAFKKRANITPKHFQNSQFAQGGSVYTAERHFSLDRLTQLAEYSGIIEFIDGDLKFHGNAKHLAGLLGYSESDLRSRPFMDFVVPDDHQIAQQAAQKIAKGKNILDLNIRMLSNSGIEIPVQFSALLKGRNWFWFIKYAAVSSAAS